VNIGDVSTAADLPAKTIRYYEEIGLIRPARGQNGYRSFSQSDLHKLRFLGRARALGFSIEDCRTLLALYEDEGRASSEVRKIAESHLRDIRTKITTLDAMRQTLEHLVSTCAGDDRPDCPILNDLGGSAHEK
jgi:Cu(I)-responsive transcriptional regulator